jgi:mono/diheme cytochrome c family protein
MASAILACITGFVLSRTGQYEEGLRDWHQWMGICVAIVSILTFYFRRKPVLRRWQSLMATLLLILIIITGHLGGSLTHGTDYLTSPLVGDADEDTVTIHRKPIADLQHAYIYADIVQPIFRARCYSCHGPNRQKGKLRLDDPDRIMKGGKDGIIIVAGKPDKSELVKRIFLPRNDEHHMAPKEKKQLTEDEKSLIRWWVEQGADFTKKVMDVDQPDKLKPALMALQKEEVPEDDLNEFVSMPVEKANAGDVAAIRSLGALIEPVAQNANYLEINFLGSTNLSDQDLKFLIPLKNQLVRIKAGNKNISDSGLYYIGQCSRLVSLQLDHTKITDQGLEILLGLHQLRILNLVGTKTSVSGIMKLRSLEHLKAIYLYETLVNKQDWNALKAAFPKTSIDSGGYRVPFLTTDTAIVKPPKLAS